MSSITSSSFSSAVLCLDRCRGTAAPRKAFPISRPPRPTKRFPALPTWQTLPKFRAPTLALTSSPALNGDVRPGEPFIAQGCHGASPNASRQVSLSCDPRYCPSYQRKNPPHSGRWRPGLRRPCPGKKRATSARRSTSADRKAVSRQVVVAVAQTAFTRARVTNRARDRAALPAFPAPGGGAPPAGRRPLGESAPRRRVSLRRVSACGSRRRAG